MKIRWDKLKRNNEGVSKQRLELSFIQF
jgi:hypothetical protein